MGVGGSCFMFHGMGTGQQRRSMAWPFDAESVWLASASNAGAGDGSAVAWCISDRPMAADNGGNAGVPMQNCRRRRRQGNGMACTSGPQRLSALYQYHNAPEVAPAHGLEYDDTIYPSSDKFPVIRESPVYDAKLGKHGFAGDNRPPRIIFGMKIRTFLLVALLMVLIIVGAAVGGAVGGQQLRENQAQQTAITNSPVTQTTSKGTATSTYSAPTPTYTPLNECPDSNNTEYTSQYASGSSGSVPEHARLKFTKYCNLSNPLSDDGAQRIAEAYVYSFSDCVEVCAGYNFWNDGANCTVAIYQPGGERPGNCWVGNAGSVQASDLNTTQGTDVAILHS
ncbi:uncharacterized protein MYCFIDRAFT_191928 [Pseudocercospora fijiensis CIRAD86]|uniref:Apple domain-containing protein n=1 Tax=Pseudocercospora fijiensis (strain CIRAD86) TaxID=383855 RepID=N1Q7D4_PSEFD|nr:uncharacterized protein MYCFIDRAFT_191928 [Pseudocercospora fijiensis CIRAD86]EME87511.1 hypothetical protein MYCFIDRAFT_191928 [Pseudocercospora fijiensis CIRAD86]